MILRNISRKLLLLFGIAVPTLTATYVLAQAPGDEIWSGSQYDFGIEWADDDSPLIEDLCPTATTDALRYVYNYAGKKYTGYLFLEEPFTAQSCNGVTLDVYYEEFAGPEDQPINWTSWCVGRAQVTLDPSGSGQFSWRTTAPPRIPSRPFCDLTDQNATFQLQQGLRGS